MTKTETTTARTLDTWAATLVWLGYGDTVGGFEGIIGDFDKPVKGWPVTLVGVQRVPLTADWAVGDEVTITVWQKASDEAAPRRTLRGVVESIEDEDVEYPINVELKR